jgi:hypothetical protein
MQAMRQVVFTDVQIVGRLDVDCQSFAPIGYQTPSSKGKEAIKKFTRTY